MIIRLFRAAGLTIFALIAIWGGITHSDVIFMSGHITQGGNCESGNDSSTVLLIHSNTTDESTTFDDSGAGPNCPHTVNANGNVNHEADQQYFGATSIQGDGSSYLTVPDHADWNFASSDFTVDCWIRLDDVGANNHDLFGQNVDWYLSFNKIVGPYFYHASFSFQQGNTTDWSADTWYHVALVRTGNDFIVFRSGTSVASTTNAAAMPDSGTSLFCLTSGAGGDKLGGYMDEIRVSKGIARWTANFTPPTLAYCD